MADLATLLAKELPQGRFWNKAWSLVEGCTPVSPGCKHCWLAGMYGRNLPNLTPGLINPKTKHFNGSLAMSWDRLEIPLHRRKPTVYAIWSDLFHEGVPQTFRDHAFAVMAYAPQHYFIIVTKRPQVAVEYFQTQLRRLSVDRTAFDRGYIKDTYDPGTPWPLSNVIIMVTMEDQERVNSRWDDAMRLATAGWAMGTLHEPLLSEIVLPLETFIATVPGAQRPQWIITGGESGTGARPVHPDWVRSLRDQAQAAGVPFLFKQWGEWIETPKITEDPTVFNEAITTIGMKEFRRVGKKRAGHLLDGQEHLGVPGR